MTPAGESSDDVGEEGERSATALLDGNVLIALSLPEHVHSEAALSWFAAHSGPFASTPITQGTLLRVAIRMGAKTAEAAVLLDRLVSNPRHVQWWDDVPYDANMLSAVRGHGHVTDAYLAAIAGRHGGRLVSFDRGIGVRHPDVAEVIPT